jgi:hypothetical protein
MNLPTSAWTIVGNKCKFPVIKPMTVDDLYNSSFNVDEESPAQKAIALLLQESKDTNSTVKNLHSIISLALEQINSITKKKICEIKSTTDNQQTVLEIDKVMPITCDILLTLDTFYHNFKEHISNLRNKKKICLDKMQQFLKSCGFNSINKNATQKKSKTYASIAELSETLDSLSESSLVIQKMPVQIISNIEQPQLMPVDTGIVDLLMPVSVSHQESMEHTLTYLTDANLMVIRMNGITYSAGPGVFIDYKKGQTMKAENAKRCHNSPCRFKMCKYYHDPLTIKNTTSSPRTFVLSYVNQLLRDIKDNDDILNNTSIRRPDFVRDLVQLAGVILYRASQIRTMYFGYSL